METATRAIPVIDPNNIEAWREQFSVSMMDKNRSQLGLRPQPVGGPLRNLEAWQARNDTCYSSIFQACKKNQDAMTICQTYHRSKDRAVPPQDPIAGELLDLLEQRFRRENQTVVEDWIRKYNEFKFKDAEALPVGTDRFKGLIQQLAILGQAPTEESKCERFKAALATSSFRQLASFLAMEELNFDQLCIKTKRWWDAEKKSGDGPITTNTKPVTQQLPTDTINAINVRDVKCDFCGTRGHMYRDCKKRRMITKFGGKRNKREEARCWKCNSSKHVMMDCPYVIEFKTDKRGNRVPIVRNRGEESEQSNGRKVTVERRSDRDSRKRKQREDDDHDDDDDDGSRENVDYVCDADSDDELPDLPGYPRDD